MNIANRPSALSAPATLSSSACAAPVPPLTFVVDPARRSCTNTSRNPLVSPGTRFVAAESNMTNRPSALIDPWKLSWLACPPPPRTLTRSVVRVTRSRTNTSEVLSRGCPLRQQPAHVRAWRPLPARQIGGE